ncbi:MAG: nucleotidyl transferase AbiEii/AbiGii toxin family protein, partial [Eubacteriales bacterium]|nr:nucleotidyl transferase AbiEii/AbiGii toxin family protein [Eubacteriales bacterium]
TSLSQGQKKKLKYVLVEVIEAMGLEIPNLDDTRSRRDYNRYDIAYTSVSDIESEAVKPTVLLETSYITVSFPTVMLDVHNMIGDMMAVEAPEMIGEYRLEPFKMKVQGLDRTLADKVFAICDYYLQGKERKHSRHLYDIYKLLPLVPQDEAFKALVKEVRNVRSKSPICPSAKEDVVIPELLKEIVDKEIYKMDYEVLTTRLLDDDVSYKTAISAILQIAGTDIFE